MSKHTRRRVRAAMVVLLVAIGSLVVGCSGETASPPDVGRRSEPLDSTARPRFETPTVNSAIEYVGRLAPLNDSGVRGTVTVRVDASVIRVTTVLRGLAPSDSYRVRLHGFPDRRLPALPPFRETVTAREIDESIGPALVGLGTFRVGGGDGSVREETRVRVRGRVYPLDVRAIVVSAVLPDGGLSPVAAGVLKPVELGDGGVGGPGSPGGGGGAGDSGGGMAPGGMTPGERQGGTTAPGTGQGAGEPEGASP